MSPIGVWCHLGAQEQACRRSKCVNSVLVSSASSHEVCVREPRAALCPASRRGRASPVGVAPPHYARTRQPSLPSRPARAIARPAPVHPSIPPAGARPVVAWRCAPLARGQHHGMVDSRAPSRPLPLCEPCASTTRRQCRGRRAVCASTAMPARRRASFGHILLAQRAESSSAAWACRGSPPLASATVLSLCMRMNRFTVHQHASRLNRKLLCCARVTCLRVHGLQDVRAAKHFGQLATAALRAGPPGRPKPAPHAPHGPRGARRRPVRERPRGTFWTSFQAL